MPVASLTIACAVPAEKSNDDPYLPIATLRAEPAAAVAPSGAAVMREVGAERFLNVTGYQAAFFGHVYGVQLSSDDVFTFYEGELRGLGRMRDSKPILSSGELRGWSWCKPPPGDLRP